MLHLIAGAMDHILIQCELLTPIYSEFQHNSSINKRY